MSACMLTSRYSFIHFRNRSISFEILEPIQGLGVQCCSMQPKQILVQMSSWVSLYCIHENPGTWTRLLYRLCPIPFTRASIIYTAYLSGSWESWNQSSQTSAERRGYTLGRPLINHRANPEMNSHLSSHSHLCVTTIDLIIISLACGRNRSIPSKPVRRTCRVHTEENQSACRFEPRPF